MHCNKKTKSFAIVASTDPYHANVRYNGEEVLEVNGATPVKWVNSRYDTMNAALDALERIVSENDNLMFEDDCSIEEFRKGIVNDGGSLESAQEQTKWYEGPGYYEDGYENGKKMIYKAGDDDYREDVMYYEVIECEENEVELEQEQDENE